MSLHNHTKKKTHTRDPQTKRVTYKNPLKKKLNFKNIFYIKYNCIALNFGEYNLYKIAQTNRGPIRPFKQNKLIYYKTSQQDYEIKTYIYLWYYLNILVCPRNI